MNPKKINIITIEIWVTFLLCVSQFSEWVYSIIQIENPKIKVHIYVLESS